MRAEAELAVLAIRQRLLNEKHALEEEELRKRKARLQLEEEEEQLRKRKEKLLLDTDIKKMAKLNVLRTQSITSGKRSSKVSDGMNSYLKKGKSQQQLNVNAEEFHPSAAAKPKPMKDENQLVKQTVMEMQHSRTVKFLSVQFWKMKQLTHSVSPNNFPQTQIHM